MTNVIVMLIVFLIHSILIFYPLLYILYLLQNNGIIILSFDTTNKYDNMETHEVGMKKIIEYNTSFFSTVHKYIMKLEDF